jgi:hypothetical protein
VLCFVSYKVRRGTADDLLQRNSKEICEVLIAIVHNPIVAERGGVRS